MATPRHQAVTRPVVTRSHEAYVEIKRRVLDLRMPPGSEFTEGELAADLGASKTPIREALARLRQEGLVDAVARSGYRVTPVTVKDARDLMGLRTLLEGEAAALAAAHGADVAELRDLERLCQASYDPADRASIVTFLAANFQLHLAIGRMSGNARLTESLQETLEQLERVMHLGLAVSSRAGEVVHEHQELVAAILEGDAEAAREAAIAQARAAQRMTLEALLSSDVVMSMNLGARGMGS
ncbi:MAG: GntR family transcriptional regulator [Mycobacteriales bacterium]